MDHEGGGVPVVGLAPRALEGIEKSPRHLVDGVGVDAGDGEQVGASEDEMDIPFREGLRVVRTEGGARGDQIEESGSEDRFDALEFHHRLPLDRTIEAPVGIDERAQVPPLQPDLPRGENLKGHPRQHHLALAMDLVR